MKFGLELATSAYNGGRQAFIARTLPSIARTNISGLDKPVLRITHAQGSFDYAPYFEALKAKFDTDVVTDPVPAMWPYIIYQDAGLKLLQEHEDVTHLVFLWDDFIYHSEWLQELSKLILRHPDGIAWSIYRSRYTDYHRVIGEDGVDVLMTMHDGIGCVTRQEWLEFSSLGFEISSDIKHAEKRRGNRWATSRDYAQNLGVHGGLEKVDCAIDFVGEG